MIIVGTDIETTGLLDPAHRIIEVAVLAYDYDPATHDFQLVDSYEQRINPKRSIDAKAAGVHGIAATDLIGKPVWEDVAQTFADKLSRGAYIVGHNFLSFDGPFILQELDRVGVKEPEGIPFDTMLDGRSFTGFGETPSLQKLCFACGIDYDPEKAHSALYDVDVMMRSFFFGLKRGAFSL